MRNRQRGLAERAVGGAAVVIGEGDARCAESLDAVGALPLWLGRRAVGALPLWPAA